MISISMAFLRSVNSIGGRRAMSGHCKMSLRMWSLSCSTSASYFHHRPGVHDLKRNGNGSVPAIRQLGLETWSAGTDSGARYSARSSDSVPGAVYHVMNRGDRREPIFSDDTDCQSLLETLGQACGK